jgi:glycosyltransferase involved in cell wall biosynthesis
MKVDETASGGPLPGPPSIAEEVLMMPCVLVAQLGARMHYAVPRILHEAGALDRFFTDICATGAWARTLGALPAGIVPRGLRRLAMRRPVAIPHDRITAFTAFGLGYARRRTRARTVTEETWNHLRAGREFCERILAIGFGKATMVYAFNSAALELLVEARRAGLTTVLEQTIAPAELVDTLLLEQLRRFPDWGAPLADRDAAEMFYARERAEWAAADLIVCGSEFVRESISRCGGPADRCVVVPYGVDHRFSLPPREPRQGPLHVLTIGEVGLRKGSPYVLEAARRLVGSATFRMVGPCSLPARIIDGAPSNLEILGPVPRGDIMRHYAWADVFLLPSICEGSATVVYEALTAGLPVICTPNTGSVVRDGVEGFIVSAGDPDGIVHALDKLARDPALRRTMAERAGARSREFDLASYGRRLLSALCQAAGDPCPSPAPSPAPSHAGQPSSHVVSAF